MSNIQQFISILELKIDPKLTAQPESWHFNDLLDLRQDERVSAMIYPYGMTDTDYQGKVYGWTGC